MDRNRREEATDADHAGALAANKARLMLAFLEATQEAMALDIGGEDEAATARFFHLVALRESLIGDIDEIDRELHQVIPDNAAMSGDGGRAVSDSLERARKRTSEALALSRELEANLAIVCRRLEGRGARMGTPLQARSSYGNAGDGEVAPRFLDRRL